jgi:hypothetical protein
VIEAAVTHLEDAKERDSEESAGCMKTSPSITGSVSRVFKLKAAIKTKSRITNAISSFPARHCKSSARPQSVYATRVALMMRCCAVSSASLTSASPAS